MTADGPGPGLLDHLRDWLPAQRWFPAKGQRFDLWLVGALPLPAPGVAQLPDHDRRRLWQVLVGVRVGAQVRVLQVPVSRYGTAQPALAGALIGTWDGHCYYDAPHDPAFVGCLLQVIADGAAPTPAPPAGGAEPGGLRISGHTLDGAGPDPQAPSRVLRGEQSNTSIIVDGTASHPDPLMLKLFRVVTNGANPDVEVAAALTRAGEAAVPAVIGWLSGSWAPARGVPAQGHLAVCTRFLAGSRDAWRVALDAARAGTDFTARAHELGRVTASVHAALARTLGVAGCDETGRRQIVADLRNRVRWAIAEAGPELADLAAALERHRQRLDELSVAEIGNLQRIHGDYHLGQVLQRADNGWALLDFEGEPLRPLAERTRPDLPLRDVVGMLRSFDYAAAFVALDTPQVTAGASTWARDCQRAFTAGYTGAPAASRSEAEALSGRLFDALWLDKALYEVVYEARNRPDWVPIPLEAVRRVLAG